ncbi:MAG TPA: hypothetical protein VN914_04860 [Polyangia bacterium]|nr:hypothetical protein [Polyangia bacterium]
MKIVAHVLTCPERAPVLRNTLASLRASDWGEEPRVLENRDQHRDGRVRIQRGTRAVLERALAEGAEAILYLEDDLVFNRHLRRNLEAWAPLAAAAPDAPFYGTLFRPPGIPVLEGGALANTARLPAERTFGNLALVLSRATMRHALEHWDEEVLEADAKLARLAGRLGPLWLHTPSLVQHVGGRSVWGGVFLQAEDFSPVWTAGEDASDCAPLTPATARSSMDAFIARIPPCPEDFAGTGIVIAAGGLDYLANAWVAVTLLREHGCALPIELWHLGPEEMPESLRQLFAEAGVECVDAHTRFAAHPARSIRGWAIKPYAILASRFRHVLLLDADNVPVRDPGFLFECAQYRETGALFWPDRPEGVGIPGSLLRPNHPVWRLTGLSHRGDPSFETGQLCVDKVRCWRELRLALWMNEHADFWYRYLYGDKDTFQIAWRKLGTEWAMPSERPAMLEDKVFCQSDFEGRLLFQHRFGDKWRLDGSNRAIPGFLHEDRCRQALSDLAARLLPAIEVGRGRPPAKLAPGRWLWTRAGGRARVLSFLPGGFVDGGKEKAARLWRNEGGVLTLLGDDLAVSARFRFVPRAAAWLGVEGQGATLVRVSGRAVSS